MSRQQGGRHTPNPSGAKGVWALTEAGAAAHRHSCCPQGHSRRMPTPDPRRSWPSSPRSTAPLQALGEGEGLRTREKNRQKPARPGDAISLLAGAAGVLPAMHLLPPRRHRPLPIGLTWRPPPRCGGRSKNREHRDPLWHRPQQGARTLCSQPCSSKEKADGDRCGGAPPPLARERQVSTGEETWGRRAAPTLRCGGRRPPPHPTPRSPLTRPAAGASAGKLGTPAPAPPQGSGTLLCSVPRGGGRRKKRHRGEVSRRSQRRRDRSCPPSGLGAGAPGHRGTLRPRPPGAGRRERRARAGARKAAQGSAVVPQPTEATYVCCCGKL